MPHTLKTGEGQPWRNPGSWRPAEGCAVSPPGDHLGPFICATGREDSILVCATPV